jgi:hypothetical protein
MDSQSVPDCNNISRKTENKPTETPSDPRAFALAWIPSTSRLRRPPSAPAPRPPTVPADRESTSINTKLSTSKATEKCLSEVSIANVINSIFQK